jgi:hypothetical protein
MSAKVRVFFEKEIDEESKKKLVELVIDYYKNI